MTWKPKGIVFENDRKKENGALNLVFSLIIAGVFLFFYKGCVDAYREASPPARYVENQDR